MCRSYYFCRFIKNVLNDVPHFVIFSSYSIKLLLRFYFCWVLPTIYVFFCSIIGINCTVLERNKAFSKHPQAHFINNRSMEVKNILLINYLISKKASWFILISDAILDIPQNWWPCWRDPKVSTTSRFMEEIYILYFPLWFNSWIGWSHTTSRCYSVVHESQFPVW